MALDPMERDQLRKKMALRMSGFLESAPTVSCVSAHFNLEPNYCELCDNQHAHELFVIKNRSGKKLRVASQCLREMVRFRVAEVEELSKWLLKMPDLKLEAERKREEQARVREEERKRLEKKVIVRKKQPEGAT